MALDITWYFTYFVIRTFNFDINVICAKCLCGLVLTTVRAILSL